jgi:hypothetical protein
MKNLKDSRAVNQRNSSWPLRFRTENGRCARIAERAFAEVLQFRPLLLQDTIRKTSDPEVDQECASASSGTSKVLEETFDR